MAPKHAFRRAQQMANDTGKKAYVIYDQITHTYWAQTERGNEEEKKLINEVLPKRIK